ncbi:MAG: hypothetical protein ACRD1B_07235 [Thermoanaerobaculia bacterium]
MALLKRLLREPLVHFLLLGALLFLGFKWKGGGSAPGSSHIEVTPGQIEHLASGFALTWQRPPNEAELKGLIDDYVKEEIATREAVAMGLDRDDIRAQEEGASGALRAPSREVHGHDRQSESGPRR